MTFANEYKVSVQFGSHTYSSNRDISWDEPIIPEAELVETALIDPNGNFVEYAGDDVQGYRNAEQVLELMNYAARQGYNIRIGDEVYHNGHDCTVYQIVGTDVWLKYNDPVVRYIQVKLKDLKNAHER